MPDPWLMLCDRRLDWRDTRAALVRRVACDVSTNLRNYRHGARHPALVLRLRLGDADRRGAQFGVERANAAAGSHDALSESSEITSSTAIVAHGLNTSAGDVQGNVPSRSHF